MTVFGKVLPGVTYEDRPGAYGFLFNSTGRLAVIETSHGRFLPGGGLDPGESEVEGLRRELREEISYELTRAEFFIHATQFHWSSHYRKHFKKIGGFYRIEATPPPQPRLQNGHFLLWMVPGDAVKTLSQEFQRWALEQSL